MSDDRSIAENEAIFKIFMPLAFERQQQFLGTGGRLVHYTSADAAINMIKSEEIWMRNAQCMNDFTEVQHGYDYLRCFFSNVQSKKAFNDALNGCAEGVAQDTINHFDGWWRSIQTNTYITCISEHDDNEDNDGRLSMWRAYGQGSVGVAVVMNGAVFGGGGADLLKAYISPVSYLTKEEFYQEIHKVVENIRQNQSLISTLPRDEIIGWAYNALLFAVTCLKHPGFHEEREWRVIHTPEQDASSFLNKCTEIIRGIPQNIYKIPLKNIPDEGLTGIEIPELINRIIIGPSEYPRAIYDAFVSVLTKARVEDAKNKVFVSGIPLRTSAA